MPQMQNLHVCKQDAYMKARAALATYICKIVHPFLDLFSLCLQSDYKYICGLKNMRDRLYVCVTPVSVGSAQ